MCQEISQREDLLARLADFFPGGNSQAHFEELCREDKDTWFDHVDFAVVANLLHVNIHIHERSCHVIESF
jgi:hypothetical protein